MYARFKLTPLFCLFPGQTFPVSAAPPPPQSVWLSMEDRGWPLELHAGPPLIYQWHCWLTEHLFTLTHEYSIYSYFKGTKDISIHRREERHLSLCSLSSCILPHLSLFPPPFPLPTSLYMCNLNIGSNMQDLISCACFIRGVDQETFFSLTLWASQHNPAPFARRKSPICPLSAQTL